MMISQRSAADHLTLVSQSTSTTMDSDSSKENYADVTPKARSYYYCSSENKRKTTTAAPPSSWSLEDSSIEKQYHSWKPLLEPTPLLSEVTVTGAQAFPFRLHEMLDDAEPKGFTSVVSWQDDGKSFLIHDRDLFSTAVLPRYFEGQTKYKSFQRQLNLYNFVRSNKGPNKGAYGHEFFIQGKPKMCRFMVRIKIKSNRKRGGCSSASASSAVARIQKLQACSGRTSKNKETRYEDVLPVSNLCSSSEDKVVLRSVKTLLETLQRTGPTMNDIDRQRYTNKILELSSSVLKKLGPSCPSRADAASSASFQEQEELARTRRTSELAASALRPAVSSPESPSDSFSIGPSSCRRESLLKYCSGTGSVSNLMGESLASIHVGDDLFDIFNDDENHHQALDGQEKADLYHHHHHHHHHQGHVFVEDDDDLLSAHESHSPIWANPTTHHDHYAPGVIESSPSYNLFSWTHL